MGSYNLDFVRSTMFCPTAVDQFFVTQLSKLDLNQNHKNNNTYKQGVSLEQRKVEATDSRIRYPTKIPLAVKKNHREKSLAPIDKMKWLVPYEMTILQLSLVLKKRLKCPPQVQFFLLINGREFPPINTPLATLHSKFSDEDGFLYLTYSSQECFG